MKFICSVTPESFTRSKLRLVPKGDWCGLGNRVTREFTGKELEGIVGHFAMDGARIDIGFESQELGPFRVSEHPVKLGTINRLVDEHGDLWGYVDEWTPLGAELVEAGYRYAVAVVDFAPRARLTSVSLSLAPAVRIAGQCYPSDLAPSVTRTEGPTARAANAAISSLWQRLAEAGKLTEEHRAEFTSRALRDFGAARAWLKSASN